AGLPRRLRRHARHHSDGLRRNAAEGAPRRDRAPRRRGRPYRPPRGRGAPGERRMSVTPPSSLRVVVVNGSPNEPSKTTGLVEVVGGTLDGLVPIESARVDVYRLGQGFTGAIEREDVTPDVEAALDLAENADLLIAATPVFRASYPGMFKHFFDLVDQYAL